MDRPFRRVLYMLTMLIVAAGPLVTHAAPREKPVAVDAANIPAMAPGPNVPPVGRALFDELVFDKRTNAARVPFPFATLLRELASRAGCKSQKEPECYRAVLIPLGRSLQRTVAAPHFFKYPRVVVAFTGEASDTRQHNLPLLKDRLYLGYQEKANLIEVISYNEEAGRFEFQLVRNYAPGRTPEIVYANRAVCVSCHQSQAPIFARQVWDETNANPDIARRLAREGRPFHGVPINTGVDVPNAIDDATDRANLLAVYQLLWRDGCDGIADAARRCRAQALLAALQYRLTSSRGFQQDTAPFVDDFLTPFSRNWRTRWPAGIPIADNDIANRDPLQSPDAEKFAHVTARFEALLPRGSKETWQLDTDRYQLIKGIGDFFTRAEINAIAKKLRIRVSPSSELPAHWNSRGFQMLRDAVLALANDAEGNVFDRPTIQHAALRDALFRRLGIDGPARRAPVVRAMREEESAVAAPTDPAFAPFYAHCGRCHASSQSVPPNFLYGTADAVKEKLKRCADRIHFRLSMSRLALGQRPKTPMPPETVADEHAANWRNAPALASMLAQLEPWLSSEMKVAPEQLIGRSYEQLRACAVH